MVRLLTVLWVLLAACQSTSRRSDSPRVVPDKTTGPQFDDEDVPDESPSKTDPKQTGNEPEVDSETELPDGKVILSAEVVITDELPEGNLNLPFGVPKMTGGEAAWIIARDQYVISWNPKTRNPNWTAWKITAADIGTIGRQDGFTIDPALSQYLSRSQSTVKAVTSRDYTGSCFDRGHQVASSDRQASTEDNVATFFMTNILPQTAFLNQKIWKSLEDQTRKWIVNGTYQNILVVAGPVYEKTKRYTGSGQDIAIPSANYKLVYAWDDNAADKPFLVKAVLIPNMNSQGKLAYEDPTRLCAESKSGGQIKGETILKSIKFDDYKATVQAIQSAAHIRLPEALTK